MVLIGYKESKRNYVEVDLKLPFFELRYKHPLNTNIPLILKPGEGGLRCVGSRGVKGEPCVVLGGSDYVEARGRMRPVPTTVVTMAVRIVITITILIQAGRRRKNNNKNTNDNNKKNKNHDNNSKKRNTKTKNKSNNNNNTNNNNNNTNTNNNQQWSRRAIFQAQRCAEQLGKLLSPRHSTPKPA